MASNVKEMETNAEQIKVSQKSIQSCNPLSLNFPSQDLKTTLNTTTTLALENQDTCEKVNELSSLIQTNTEELKVSNL